MKQKFEIRFEIKPIVPDTVENAQSRLRSTIDEIISSGEFDDLWKERKPELIFAQGLPTVEQVTLVVAVLNLFCELPQAWPYVRPFLEGLGARIRGATRGDITVEITWGDRRARVEGLEAGEAFKLLAGDYEVFFQPRQEDD